MVKDVIINLIQSAAAETGFLVYDSSVQLGGASAKLVIRIDSENGISLADCQKYSTVLTELLEAEGNLPDFTLEVSSPGINRKLRSTDEFKRFEGAPVRVLVREGAGRKTIKGIFHVSSSGELIIKSEKKEISLSFDDIIQANLDY